MTLTARFALLVFALFSAVVAVAATGLWGQRQLHDALHATVEEDVRRVLVVTDARRLFRSMVVAERDLMLEPSAEKRAEQVSKMIKLREDLRLKLDELGGLALPQDRAAADSLPGVRARWIEVDDEVLAALEASDLERARAASARHAADPVSWEKVIAELIKSSDARLSAQMKARDQQHARARRIVVGVTVGAGLLALGVGALIFRGIRRNIAQVEATNANLEGLVAKRTEALGERERAMQLVLDSTGDGLLRIELSGRILPERSRAIDQWFCDTTIEGAKLWDVLFPDDAKGRLRFQLAFEQLVEDLFPFEIAATELFPRFSRAGRHYEIGFRDIREGEVLASVLCVIRDATRLVEQERSEADAREQQAVVRHLVKDRRGFMAGVSECQRLLEELASEQDRPRIKRALHTLKGTTMMFGFASVATHVDALESELEERPALSAGAIAELCALFRLRLRRIEDFLRPQAALELGQREHAQLIESLESRREHALILSMIEGWRWPQSSELLARLGAQAEQLAARFDKPIQVELRPNGLRLAPGELDGFWATLVHVVRNAVDHGIEDRDARLAAGKPERGQLIFETALSVRGELVVSMSDDGVGIDTTALLSAARERGVALDRATWHQALFADGVTTRETANEISGRGVGLGAVRSACEELGGSVSVASEPGHGTRFDFYLPGRFARHEIEPESIAA